MSQRKTLYIRANCFVRVKWKRARPKRHHHHGCAHKKWHKTPCVAKRHPCERVCGLIFQACNGGRQTYFTSLEPTGKAVVRVQNDAACEMRIIMETRCRQFVQIVSQGQQVSVAVPSLHRFSVECGECGGDGAYCRGQYEIQWQLKYKSA